MVVVERLDGDELRENLEDLGPAEISLFAHEAERNRAQSREIAPWGEGVRDREGLVRVPGRLQLRERREELRPSGEKELRVAPKIDGPVAAHEAVDFVSVGVEEDHRRKRVGLVARRDALPLALLRVDPRRDDILLRPVDDGGVGKGRRVHDLARPAPGGHDVEHDGLVLGLRAAEDLGEGLALNERDVRASGR